MSHLAEYRAMQIGLFPSQSFCSPRIVRAEKSAGAEGAQAPPQEQPGAEAAEGRGRAHSTPGARKAGNGNDLSGPELHLLRQLAARDREVRAHEQAHLAAAGGYATGGPTFSYQTGPDGVRYAVGGEVGIDTSPVAGNPRATLAKAQAIIAAANAPAEPSGQDRAVAAAAAQMAARAQAEISQTVAIAAYAGKEKAAESSFAYSF